MSQENCKQYNSGEDEDQWFRNEVNDITADLVDKISTGMIPKPT